jgi:hypothetical protein
MEQQKYPSKYSNNKFVSAAQYITEMICERKAKKDKTDLHYRFWLNKKWSAFFKNQIASSHKLLKRYSARSIIAALLTDDGQKIYSLRAPHLPDIIELKESEFTKENTTLTKNIERKTDIVFGNNQYTKINKNNIISKLEDLDNAN